ncbi:MAG: hypothetical protein HY391_04745 [Deltaproteobacteria bacterium]|nr:hypothetical protein [Deltaproteobacteria bacterium]
MKRMLFFVFSLSALFLANCGDDIPEGTSEESVSSAPEGDFKQGNEAESQGDTAMTATGEGADCCSDR